MRTSTPTRGRGVAAPQVQAVGQQVDRRAVVALDSLVDRVGEGWWRRAVDPAEHGDLRRCAPCDPHSGTPAQDPGRVRVGPDLERDRVPAGTLGIAEAQRRQVQGLPAGRRPWVGEPVSLCGQHERVTVGLPVDVGDREYQALRPALHEHPGAAVGHHRRPRRRSGRRRHAAAGLVGTADLVAGVDERLR